MRNYKTYSLFMVSFLISAVVLLIPTVVAVLLLSTPNIVSSEDYAAAYYPVRREDLTVLLGGKGNTNTIGTTILAKFSPLDQKITLSVIPSEMMVEYGGRFDSLSGLWKKQGGEKAALALSSALGIDIDRYALVDLSGFVTIVDSVGRIEFNVSDQIKLEGGAVAIATGVQPLDGRKISTILTYRGYPLEESQRLTLVDQVAVSAINQRLPSLTMAGAETLFNVAVNLADTNITYNDFHFRKGAIYYLTNQQSVAQSVPVEGTYNQAKNTFIISSHSLEKIQEAFSNS